MNCAPGIVFLTGFIALGVLGIAGAYFRWAWLVDPANEHWWSRYYSQATLKRWFGRRVVLVYTYVIGALFIVAGLFGFIVNWSSLTNCFR
jgi:small-conductance mechanosensitive channel